MCPGFHFGCEDKQDEKVVPCRGHREKLSLNDSARFRVQLCFCTSTLLMSSTSNFHAPLHQGMEGQMQSKSQDTSQRLHMTLSGKKIFFLSVTIA